MITPKRKNRIKEAAGRRQEGAVVLEDIHDPHNAAAVLRTCEAFGIQKVCFIFEQEQEFNPKKVGKAASSSANKWLDFEVFDSTKKCLAALQKRGYKVLATVLDGQAKPLHKTRLADKKIALMFGNEHRGLSRQAMDLADGHAYIPMQGFVQSLNLSVTAAICLYELFRQRSAKGLEGFLLPPAQRKKLVSRWIRQA